MPSVVVAVETLDTFANTRLVVVYSFLHLAIKIVDTFFATCKADFCRICSNG